MTIRRTWTRDELLLALRLYMRLPFGKLHKRNPEIIALAQKLDRTPSSVGMKACNFASLDPDQRDRGIAGLSGASAADRGIWNEFSNNPEQLAAECEEAAENLGLIDTETLYTKAALVERRESKSTQHPTTILSGETEQTRWIRGRRVQSFFRAAVLTSYGSRCAISGIAIADLLNASHIIPWSASVERRADPTNGLCLNALFDRAFDRGLITLDDDHRVVVASTLVMDLESAALRCDLEKIHGRPIIAPTRFLPNAEALAFHREHVFGGNRNAAPSP
ncbi:MAG: HNH endonuclease [Planctomycetaceae bacterium]